MVAVCGDIDGTLAADTASTAPCDGGRGLIPGRHRCRPSYVAEARGRLVGCSGGPPALSGCARPPPPRWMRRLRFAAYPAGRTEWCNRAATRGGAAVGVKRRAAQWSVVLEGLHLGQELTARTHFRGVVRKRCYPSSTHGLRYRRRPTRSHPPSPCSRTCPRRSDSSPRALHTTHQEARP